mgnify:CR=1 FL=1
MQRSKGFHLISGKWFTFLMVLILALGCKKVTEETGLVGICPQVVSTNPTDTASGVSVSTTIEATFNEEINPSTITTTTFTLKQGTTAIAGSVTYTGMTATFSPSFNLSPNTIYTGTISKAVKDPAGNAPISDYVWSFTTGAADVTPPVVVSTDPPDSATSVLLDKKITATFSEVMDSLTINATTFVLKQGTTAIGGTVTYAGATATFSPLVNLTANTTYTATITTGSKDLAGNALASDYTWNFSTGLTVVPPSILQSAALFGAIGGSAGITNQGLNTVINNGSIGTTGASTLITGFHDATTNAVYTETPMNVGAVMVRIYTAPPAPGDATSAGIASQALADATNLTGGTLLVSPLLGADGEGAKHLNMRCINTTLPDGSPLTEKVSMNGREVFKFAVRVMSSATREAVAKANMQLTDIAYFVPHQANFRIIDAARSSLELPPEKVVSNVERYGNTSAASVGIAMREALDDGRIKDGDDLLLVSFGAGLSWASSVMRWHAKTF